MLQKILPNNESTLDRALRVTMGLAALSLVFFGPQTAWGWLGLVPLLTGALGSCPLYTLFGFSTCPMKKAKA
jgi:fatty acid desaturase